MVVVLGTALLVLAAAMASIGLRYRPLWNALRQVRPTTPERLIAAARTGRLDGRVVAVSGVAGAGSDGFLRSAVNDESCVWHRHTVHHRQIRYRTTERGQTQRSTRRKRVADESSQEPFTLWGTSVKVEVQPSAMRVDRPESRGTRILPGLASKPFPEADEMLGTTQQMYWHREWIIRPGAPVFVLGEVGVRGKYVSLRRPAQGPHVISTRSAITVRRRAALAVLASLVIAPIAALFGAAVLIVHFV